MKSSNDHSRIRHLYVPSLYQELTQRLLDGLDHSRANDLGKTAVITGSPGTGKSAYLHRLILSLILKYPEAWYLYHPSQGKEVTEVYYGGKVF
jgi:Cdc6-like AAA superfamily ATPase